jgi:hypothetical protein
LARSWLRARVLASLTLLPLAAFAQGTGPLTSEEEASLLEIREFVEATAERYRMLAPLASRSPRGSVAGALPRYASSPAVYTRGALHLSRRLLRASNRDVVIATALAYEVLRQPSKATTVAERERERAQIARDGNAKAVDILVQVKGLSEEVVLDQMYGWLVGIHHAAVASGRPPQPGSVPPCEAIGDLLRRYPGVRERFAGRECAPG